MKVDKVLSRFAAAPEEGEELRRLARAVGDELARHRVRVLKRFRAGLARVEQPQPGSFSAGYTSALLDVVAEYEVSAQKSSNDRELQKLAVREDWRDLLLLLEEGPKLPSEIARRLSKDRPAITRILKRLRTAGLIQAFADESLDGRMRPHRLTLDGKRFLGRISGGSLGDIEHGIRIAVSLFRHLATHDSGASHDLVTLAASIVGDSQAAREAVTAWARRATEAGLIAELPGAAGLAASPPAAGPAASPPAAASAPRTETAPETPRYHLAATPPGPLSSSPSGSASSPAPLESRHEALWHGIPDLLDQISGHGDRARAGDRDGGAGAEEPAPIYVRTSMGAWGAWAYALQNRDATGMSRAIVEGDLLTGAVRPPDRPFDLIYDDPEVLRADRARPVMKEIMDRADHKFVVASDDAEAEVPEDFISLTLSSGNDE